MNALTGADTALWAEYRASVTAAREAYNLVTPTQSRFVTNSDALYATESAMRAKAELFGETVVRQSILVNTYPDKTEYVRGEKFDRTGLSLLLIWSDGSREVISDGYEIVNQDSALTLNNRTIRIRYMGLQTQISVTVRRPDVQSIEIAEYPASQSYRPGDTYMSAGLVLKVIYVDGESELVYTGYTVEAEPLKEGENAITVSYGGKSVTYTVTVGSSAAEQPEPENNDRTVIIAVSVSAAVVVAAGAVLAVVLIRKKKGKA